ncbi:MAG: hypothetical protein J6Y62_07115 [Clostridia bacterium]|nr:hypothetical protein [Clostridia bacterium]
MTTKRVSYDCDWCGKPFPDKEACDKHEEKCKKTHYAGTLFVLSQETGCFGPYWKLEEKRLSRLEENRTRLCDEDPEEKLFLDELSCGFKFARLRSVAVKGEEAEGIRLLMEKAREIHNREWEMMEMCFKALEKAHGLNAIPKKGES